MGNAATAKKGDPAENGEWKTRSALHGRLHFCQTFQERISVTAFRDVGG